MKIFKHAFWAVLALSVGSLLASCSKDDETTPAPSITIDNAANSEITNGTAFNGNVTSTENLTSVTFSYVKGNESKSFRVVSSFDDKKNYNFRLVLEEVTSDITGIKVAALDKNGKTSEKTLPVKVKGNVTSTPLSAEAPFTLTLKSSTDTETKNGIKFNKIESDAVTGTFTATGNFVILDQTGYTAINTKEALVANFDSGTKVTSFTAKSDAKFAAVYLIAKDGTTLRLVKMTNLKFAPGNNVASFTERN